MVVVHRLCLFLIIVRLVFLQLLVDACGGLASVEDINRFASCFATRYEHFTSVVEALICGCYYKLTE